jgi:SPP1 family predicted phage head-tail adaptor
VSPAPTDIAPPAIGALRDRVQLKRRDMSPEDEGGQLTTFVPVATIWGRVRALSSRPTAAGDGRATSITHSVVVRYRQDVRPGDRFVFAGRNLDVVAADDLNGHRAYLSCACSETRITG